MRKTKIIWIIWVIFSVLLFAFTNNLGTIIILFASIFLPMISGILTWINSKTVEVFIESLRSDYNNDCKCKLVVNNKSFIPISKILIKVHLKNQYTGEEMNEELWMNAPGLSHALAELTIDCKYCGTIKVSVDEVKVYDFLELFGCKAKCNSNYIIQNRPETYYIDLDVSSEDSYDMNSDEYSSKVAGDDPGEIFAIREYHEGDKVKTIHWKLTQKTGELMIRELGQPIKNLVKLHLFAGEENTPEEFDAMAKVIASLSKALIDNNIEHIVEWMSENRGKQQKEVTDIDESSQWVDSLIFDKPINKLKEIQLYLENIENQSNQKKQIIITTMKNVNTYNLKKDKNIMLITLGNKSAENLKNIESVDRIISVSNLKNEIRYIEI